MSSESLTLQQLKDMNQLARLMGATDSITSDVAGATTGLSVHAATADGATGTLATELAGKLNATAEDVKTVVSGNTLNIHIEGNASYATTAGTATTASEATGQLATDLNGKLDSNVQAVKNLMSGHEMLLNITGAVNNTSVWNQMNALRINGNLDSAYFGNDGTYFASVHGYTNGGYLVYGGVSGGQYNHWPGWNGGLYGLLISQNVAARGYYARSDRRIKTDIEDVPDAMALDQVRRIPCRYYKYTDKLLNGPNQVIGFIAQEVNEVLPSAVSKTTEAIPDHMKLAELTWEDVDGKHFMTVSNLNEDVVDGTKVKFMCYTGTPPEFNEDGSVKTPASDDFKEEEECVVMENGKFEMKKRYDSVFIYGKEVNDFLHIDKQRIFALHHSAIQELDKTVEAQKATIAAQQAAIDALMARVAALEGQ